MKELQTYIANKYSSVDSFLSDNNIKVSLTFADISRSVGFIIDGGNIQKDRGPS